MPVVLNYHFVLEAKNLINSHLKKTGKELYLVEKKAFGGIFNLLKFFWNFFKASSTIIVNDGEPMDVLGNFVDDEGSSYSQFGVPVDVGDYFYSGGQIKYDRQRNAQYTQMLSNRIVDRFYKENIILSSHLVAFVAFNLLQQQYANLDLYGLLRLPKDDRIILRHIFEKNIQLVREALIELKQNHKVNLSPIVENSSIEELIDHGIENVGNFHIKKALFIDKEGDFSSEDMNLLYYYHNRMNGYQLDSIVDIKISTNE